MGFNVTIEGMVLEPTRVEAYAKNVVLSAAAVVQSKDPKVLVTLEGDLRYPNMWVIPMGYVYANENVHLLEASPFLRLEAIFAALSELVY